MIDIQIFIMETISINPFRTNNEAVFRLRTPTTPGAQTAQPQRFRKPLPANLGAVNKKRIFSMHSL